MERAENRSFTQIINEEFASSLAKWKDFPRSEIALNKIDVLLGLVKNESMGIELKLAKGHVKNPEKLPVPYEENGGVVLIKIPPVKDQVITDGKENYFIEMSKDLEKNPCLDVYNMELKTISFKPWDIESIKILEKIPK